MIKLPVSIDATRSTIYSKDGRAILYIGDLTREEADAIVAAINHDHRACEAIARIHLGVSTT